MRKINILSMASGGLGAFGLLKSLRQSDLEYTLHTTDINDDVPMSKFSHYHKVPRATDNDFLQSILNLCRDHGIAVLIPNYTEELPVIAKNKEKFIDIGTIPIISNYESIINTINKLKSYETLKQNGISVPDYHIVNNVSDFKHAVEELGYPKHPVCFKPSRFPQGGGRGFRILDPTKSASNILFYERPGSIYDSYNHVISVLENSDRFPELLVMEYLPGEEYSVYILAESGKPYYIVPNLRISLLMMYSSVAKIVYNKEIIEICEKITDIFDFSYNFNVQIKYNRDGIPKIVEINPRNAGTIILPVAAGLNFPVWAIKLALGEEIPKNIPIKYGLGLERYWTEIFTYEGKHFTLEMNP